MSEDIKVHTDFIKFDAAHPNAVNPDILPRKWIATAKAGQVVNIKDKLCVITAEALESSVGTWKDGRIFDNHETQLSGFKIYGDKFEDPFLYFELDEQTIKNLDEGEGGSIDALATKVENQKLLKMTGVGYSILRPGNMPSCTREAGCSLPIAGEGVADGKGGNVNIEAGNSDTNINIVSGDEKLEPENQDTDKEEKENMVDEKDVKSVSYTKEQVNEISASAVLEKSEQLTALHQVALSEIETAHAAELKTLGETHTTALETQREEVQKQVEMIESLSTKFALSPEAKKTLIDAKSVEDVYTLLATLKVEKAEPVVEAEGKAKGHGITLENKVEAQAPKTRKIEEVGSYDPHTGKYVPSYREELI